MSYTFVILQALALAMPITSKVIQISPNYERYGAPGRSYILNVPATDLTTVPVTNIANVPAPGTPRLCQDKLNVLPKAVQWSPANNYQDKLLSNEISNIVKGGLPYSNEYRRQNRKGLGPALESIKTQLASLAQFALASYNVIESAESARSIFNNYKK